MWLQKKETKTRLTDLRQIWNWPKIRLFSEVLLYATLSTL